MQSKIKIIGAVGGIATGICCVTPLLAIAVAAAGAAAVVGYLDMILFPLLALFAAMFAYGLWRESPRNSPGKSPEHGNEPA